jgi:hypothetical protein
MDTSGLYCKHNDDSRIIRMAFQVVASPTIIELTTLEVSLMLLENIYSTSITHHDGNIFVQFVFSVRRVTDKKSS